jgi:hypothetical protein
MKQVVLIPVFLLLSLPHTWAQYNTGDTQLNSSLVQIDADASVNFSLFKSDMSSTYSVAPAKVDSWSVQLGLKAGDIYLILEMSRILRKPVDDVVNVYNTNKKKGWGAIAKELGIKPGSAEFKALKGGADKQAAKGKSKSKESKPKKKN